MPWCWRPSSLDPDRRTKAVLAQAPRGFPSLLDTLGWSRSEDWWNRWDRVNGLELARHQWQVPVSDDWIAFVGLPLLSRVELALNHGERALLGVSALPGCGKSTLCSWVKSASEQLGWPVEHLSIDDFYWPAEQLDHSMKGNPWAVPRAIPGSHDISGLLQSLRDWGQSGQITAPRFDKSLRNGRGDRVGSTTSQPQIVLIEGWFLGATPWPSVENEILESLSSEELNWRSNTANLLPAYQEVWSMLDDLWHLRALSNDLSARWKQQQLETLELQSGVGYRKTELADFNRMVLAALPPGWLRNLPLAEVVMDLTESRSVHEIHVKKTQLSASSSSATG